MSFLLPNIKMVVLDVVLQADIDLCCHPQFHAFTLAEKKIYKDKRQH